jgi:hypothetical protein
MKRHYKLFGHEFEKYTYSYRSDTCKLEFDYNAINPVDTCLVRIDQNDGFSKCIGVLKVKSNHFKEIKDQQEKIMSFIIKYIEEEREIYNGKREMVNEILNGLDILI